MNFCESHELFSTEVVTLKGGGRNGLPGEEQVDPQRPCCS